MKKFIVCGLMGASLLFGGSIQADEVNTSSMTKEPMLRTMDIQNDKSGYHNERIGKALEVRTHSEHIRDRENRENNFRSNKDEKVNKQVRDR